MGRGGNTAGGGAAGDAREMKLSLERTRKMMAEQLERVAQVSEVMGEQDALLRDTFQQHQASGIAYGGGGGDVRREEENAPLCSFICLVQHRVCSFSPCCSFYCVFELCIPVPMELYLCYS